MAVVKVNAIGVPQQAGPELEKRFGAHAGADRLEFDVVLDVKAGD